MADRLYLRGKTWWCWGFDVDGKRWYESTKQREKRAAELAAREITRRYAASPDRVRAQKLTLDRALNGLLTSLERKGRTPAGIRAAEYHCRHLITHLDRNRPLVSFDLADTGRYLQLRLEEGASRHTVGKELRALQQAWRRLAKLKQVPPCPDLIPDELGTVYTPRSRWLTREEYDAMLKQLAPKKAGKKGGLRHHTQDRRDYLTAYCFTGVRKSELFDYDRARDLNEKRAELHVRGTKTAGADRVIPLSPEALEVFARRASFPEWHTIVRDLKRAAERAGIPPVTPNDLRRTFCSWLCQRGVLERVCADLLGHEETTMVRAVYGHLDRPTLAAAVAKLSPVTEVVTEKASKGRAAQRNTSVKKPTNKRKSSAPGKI
jgi:integrase